MNKWIYFSYRYIFKSYSWAWFSKSQHLSSAKKKKHKMTANVKEKKNWITRKKLCNLISFFFFFWDFKSGFIYEISWRALVILLSFLMQSYDLSDYPLGVGHVLMLLVIELELKKALISYFGGQGVAYLFSPSVLKFLWKIVMIFHHSQKGLTLLLNFWNEIYSTTIGWDHFQMFYIV